MWCKPKISISFVRDSPVCFEIKEKQGDNDDIEYTLRFLLNNTGKWNALDAALIIDRYYTHTHENEYVEHKIYPIDLTDNNNNFTKRKIAGVFAPDLDYYIEFAKINKCGPKSSSDDNVSSKQLYNILLGNKKRLQKGTYIIPLKCYASVVGMKIFRIYALPSCKKCIKKA